jgi:hypothetical protein
MADKIDRPGYIQTAVDLRNGIFGKMAARDKDRLWLRSSLADVEKTVVINSASRSGSSLLYAILRNVPQVYSLSGEAVPFYKLNGFSRDSYDSDVIDPAALDNKDNRDNLSRDLMGDLSLGPAENDILSSGRLLEDYIDELALRFPLQWPQIKFSCETFRKLAGQAFEKYASGKKSFSKEEFYLELFSFLKSEYPGINPYYYDIPQNLIAQRFPQIEVPSGPPNDVLMIEEPPFILLSPKRKPVKGDLKDKTLLLKSTVDCYSMPFIRAMLPAARIKIIHLTRNPLGSINGLYDGWLFRGFFSHNLKEAYKTSPAGSGALDIRGYSDRYDWGKWWWKYDLPAGWQEYRRKSLEEVCAFQWYCANKAVKEYLDGHEQSEYCSVKYENITGGRDKLRSEIKKILGFAGLDEKDLDGLGLDQLPVIQATQAPRPYRWKTRELILSPLLAQPDISRLTGELGYDQANTGEWL